MYKIEVHKRVHQAILLFQFIGLLGSDDESSFRKYGRKKHMVVYICFMVSVGAGAYTTPDKEESLFLAAMFIGCVVQTVRLWYILWKKTKMLEIIHQMGTYSIKDKEEFNQANNKIEVFMLFASSFQLMTFCALIVLLTLPFYNRRLPLNIYFPLSWKNSNIIFWMVYAFVFYGMMLSSVCAVVNVIIWYLMLSCATKYQLLGNYLKNVSVEKTMLERSKTEKQNITLKELIALVKNHQNLLE